MNLKYSYKTDIGRIRSHNEDAVQIFKNDELLVVVVADGMGGHASGDVAAKMATCLAEAHFSAALAFASKEEAFVWLDNVLKRANADILTYAHDFNAKRMGTTLVSAIITKEFVAFASIGDSRAYILANNVLRQLTKDHTFVRELVDKGQISKQAAKFHPQKNVINKALGANKILEFDFLTLENYAIEAILLCTDGLTGMVEDQEILATLKAELATDVKVDQLVEKANANGGRDNISVALVEFSGRDKK